ncbi:hypothetical protein Mal52_31140 [Symmachiella dynata]|uniref:Alpha glucuronidase N-terminal domain-containing protein n=1 Tax=Symmachiella dynata TaxID=2527995 RepID=A0A517ZQ87_9PLAN|nr:DUF4838 domain-containing protein [Symmachiella dynata]QDU44628.1 hypothetical protein Mal52_31140 [Symmachiella dynata]
MAPTQSSTSMKHVCIMVALIVLNTVCTSSAKADDPLPTPAASADSASVVLLEKGSSKYQIVLNPSASPSERYAATELQAHFLKCTGVKLPITAVEPGQETPMIVLGCGPVATRLGVHPTADELREQGWHLKTVGPHVIIAGTAEAGTLHGTRFLLEKYLGVRWLAPGVTKTPRIVDLTIPPTETIMRPAFRWRDTSYAWPGSTAEFRNRRGENSGSGDKTHSLGNQYAFDGRAHTYYRYVPPKEFFDNHPEYFSEVGGQRIRSETQLCLTNPEVLEIVTSRMLARMKAYPHFDQHNFSQMDWHNVCECDNCREINELYGTSGGTQFWFVNRLAERTAKVYPEKLIGTLAYTYTEQPPANLQMHPNVAVWLCHMFPCCDSHPIATCPLNARFKERAIAWSKISSHLYVWHYIVNFAHYYVPFPNLRAMSADMRFYRDIGVEGVFAQAMGAGGGGGEFSLLRAYYITELLKDPDRDGQEIIREFLDGYYGAAADAMERYINLLQNKVDRDNVHMHLYTNPGQGYLPDDILDDAERLFDEAESAVEDDAELLERVRVARMPLVYARVFPRKGYDLKEGKLVFRQPLAKPGDPERFLARMSAHGFRSIRERGNDRNTLLDIARLTSQPLPVFTIDNDVISVDVVPLLGARALRITDKKSGQSITELNPTRDMLFPFHGGEEGGAGTLLTWFLGGPMDPATVTKHDASSITMASETANGFRMVRTISVMPQEPVMQVRTELINPSKKPRLARVRSMLSLDLGELKATRVQFEDLAGRTVDKDLADVVQGLRDGVRYAQERRPRGDWSFSGTKGLRVTQRFDDENLDFTRLAAFPEDHNSLDVELWTRERTLKPGESMILEHNITVDSR